MRKKIITNKESKISMVTYGSGKYEKSRQRLVKEAIQFGEFKNIFSYNYFDIPKDFRDKYKDILSLKRGGGYWIWKFPIILKALEQMEKNEILLYLDSGCVFNEKGKKRFGEYIELLEKSNNSILSFQMQHQAEKKWTTKEIFEYFKLDLDSDIANNGQLIATVYFLKNNKNSINFIKDMLTVLEKNKLLFTDYYNKNQKEFFRDNRHDQSISSIWRKINNSIIIKDETYFKNFGNEESLNYPLWACRKV